MGLIDLKIEHIRKSKHWNARHKRLDQLRTRLPRKTEDRRFDAANQQYPPMDIKLYESAKTGDVDVFITALENYSEQKNVPLHTVLDQVTSDQQDTFLHIAAGLGNEELAGFICHHFRHLNTRKNKKGDSPLHLAARGGYLGVVEILSRFRNDELFRISNWDDCLDISDEERVDLVKQRVEEKVEVNEEGNTTLHEALTNNHNDIVEYLIRYNLEAAFYVNKQGKSPLYMFVEAGDIGSVKKILSGWSRYWDVLDERLKTGKSLLHAAIMRRNIEILKEITTRKPMLIHVRDEDGNNPLDFATLIGFHEGIKYLRDESKTNTIEKDGVREDHESSHSPVSTDHSSDSSHSFPIQPVPDLKIEDIRQSIQWGERHERMKKLLEVSPIQNIVQQVADQQKMDLELYTIAMNGNIDSFISALKKCVEEKHVPLSNIFNQVTPLQNTYLHVAASFGNEELTGFIIHHFRDFLMQKNHKGDTALHIAARSGHLGVVDILVRFQNDQLRKESLLDVDLESNNESLVVKFQERVVVNDEGNTPLHEALINNNEDVADYLIKANIEEAYHVNKEGKSALYMAVEAGNIERVKTILNSTTPYIDQNFLDEVTKGKSLLHAAITVRNTVLLQEIAKPKSELIQAKDEDGKNPLHYAASTGFLDGLSLLLEEFKMDAFERDADGLFPIHLASKSGHVGVVQKLLQHCPDAREFITEDGQNILHVAAKYGKDSVVRYVLKISGHELLLNEKDKDGNTPLHLATINWHPKVVSSLTWDKRVNLKLVNNEGLTALEAAEEYMEPMASYRKRLTWMALTSAGASRAKLGKTSKINRLNSTTFEPYNMDYYKDRVNTLILVATLVATVTFAAGFTMPGGYNNSDPDQGMATLVSNRKFQVFVLCDTIAMYGAIMVAVTLIWAQLGDLSLVLNALRLAIPLLGISLTMMSCAFMVSIYLVVSKLTWLADVVLIMGIIALASLLALFIPLNLPYSSNFPVSRYISYYPFCLLMLASGCYHENHENETP